MGGMGIDTGGGGFSGSSGVGGNDQLSTSLRFGDNQGINFGTGKTQSMTMGMVVAVVAVAALFVFKR
jgi:hypothetical protein